MRDISATVSVVLARLLWCSAARRCGAARASALRLGRPWSGPPCRSQRCPNVAPQATNTRSSVLAFWPGGGAIFARISRRGPLRHPQHLLPRQIRSPSDSAAGRTHCHPMWCCATDQITLIANMDVPKAFGATNLTTAQRSAGEFTGDDIVEQLISEHGRGRLPLRIPRSEECPEKCTYKGLWKGATSPPNVLTRIQTHGGAHRGATEDTIGVRTQMGIEHRRETPTTIDVPSSKRWARRGTARHREASTERRHVTRYRARWDKRSGKDHGGHNA